MGGRLQKLSIFLIVLGFCLMSFGVLGSLYGLYSHSQIYIAWATKMFALGAVGNITGFFVMLFLSFFIFKNGDW